MKLNIITSLTLLAVSCFGKDVVNPEADYLSNYSAGDTVYRMKFDLNHDGIDDCFFRLEEANPDPLDVLEDSRTVGNLTAWSAYISNTGTNTFKVGDKIDDGEGIILGTAPTFNLDEMFVGNISEINRYGVMTTSLSRTKAAYFITIYAYTWEGSHLKKWKLAKYDTDTRNKIYDKYLKEGKRTPITQQKIKP